MSPRTVLVVTAALGLLLPSLPAHAQTTDVDTRIPASQLLADLPPLERVTVGLVVRPAPAGFPQGAQEDIGAATQRALQADPHVAQVVVPSDVAAADMQLAQEASLHGVKALVVVHFELNPPQATFSILDGRGVELRQLTRTLSQLAGTAAQAPPPSTPEEDPRLYQPAPPRAEAPTFVEPEPVKDSGPRFLTDAGLFSGGALVGIALMGVGVLLGLGAWGTYVLADRAGKPSTANDIFTVLTAVLVCGGCASCCCGTLPFVLGAGSVGVRRGPFGFMAPSPAVEAVAVEQQPATEDAPRSDASTTPAPAPAFGRTQPNQEHRSTPPPASHGNTTPSAHGGESSHASPEPTPAPPPKKKKDDEKEKATAHPKQDLRR
jgi:hypothetical protein